MAAGDIAKNHPQVEMITSMLLDGRSADEIAAKTEPRIGRVSICNFRRLHVEPALKNAQRIQAIEKARANNTVLPDLFHGDGSLNDAEASDLVREAFGAGVILAARAKRLQELQRISDDLEELKTSRAEDMTDEAPGGHTGLLVRRIKTEGRVEYLYDKALVDSKLEISQRIAQETGQWQDGGSSGVVVNIVVPGQAAGSSGPIIDVSPKSIALPTRR